MAMAHTSSQYETILKIETQTYFNFINSIDSEDTKKTYRFCISKFLNYYKLDLISFLRLPQEDIVNLVTKYLVFQKKSRPTRI